MTTRVHLRPLRPALLLGLWVLLTYGFRLVTAVRARTWDSVIASVVLLGLSIAVAVLAVRYRRGAAGTRLRPLVRVLSVLAAGWSVFRLVTVWAGTFGAAFRVVHTIIAGVLLVLAIWSLAAVRALPVQAGLSDQAAVPAATEARGAAEGSAQTVPSAGGRPVSR